LTDKTIYDQSSEDVGELLTSRSVGGSSHYRLAASCSLYHYSTIIFIVINVSVDLYQVPLWKVHFCPSFFNRGSPGKMTVKMECMCVCVLSQ